MLRETLRYREKMPNAAYYAGNRYKIKAPQARVISITSGKGGVGKTNVVANLAYVLSQIGKKVLVVDADLGLANIDILLGLTPKYNLQHVILGEKRLSEVIISGPGGVRILPASSGVEELAALNSEQKKRLIVEFSFLDDNYDFLLIDTAAGISPNVIYFNLAASEIVILVEPDPTSFTDSYAMIKVLSVKYGVDYFKILLNNVTSENEAKEIFEKLHLVTDKFLQVRLEYLGYIFHDKKLREAVRMQRAVVEIFPYAKSSQCFHQIVKALCDESTKDLGGNSVNRFINRLLGRDYL
ncbi:MAG TPA: MinD/ParA family protein [Candidatus Desulfofervidus auxilii]|uniref:MinD/ParA family protein n=1 Tax=Desulfofervidus auxilii TaxID=1621989 RepID=A0A7C0Y3V5_DESA2|nr:MinD/ParA family protein [Candidatus Desulfofervidus auxilii]